MDNSLQLKTITELLGHNFYIPNYQRGYRWTELNVTQLLDDIWEYRTKGAAKTFYCLQPVVVKKASWQDVDGKAVSGYELIDGQQRLTTLHRIITYLMLEHLRTDTLRDDYGKEQYNMYYQTRLESQAFLATNKHDSSSPDLYYMSEAYRVIKKWFEDSAKGFVRADKNKFLDTILAPADAEWSLKVIWYETQQEQKDDVQSRADSIALFTRLNRGKIPLTSAELIKATFVNSKSFADQSSAEQIKRKTEIIHLWDEIEAGLNDPKFWAFITNRDADAYSSKIELLFDIKTRKKARETDPLYSYLHFFDEEETSESLWQKWVSTEEAYRTLRFWYSDKNLYHKVGYLIAVGGDSDVVRELLEIRQAGTKSTFEKKINNRIAKYIPAEWAELRYDNSSEHDKIKQVLLLHNLEIIRQNNNLTELFPFQTYKRISKTLEHIHAQNPEELSRTNRQQWIEWMSEHLLLLREREDDSPEIAALIARAEKPMDRITYEQFLTLSKELLQLLGGGGTDGAAELHAIQNLALLGLEENVALSNSVFEVKRRKVTNMDKDGHFIPPATRRVFLKYYSSDAPAAYTIWSAADKSGYLNDIKKHIAHYDATTLNPTHLNEN